MFLFIQRFYALLVFYNILYCLIFQHLSTFLPAASPFQLFQLSRLFPFDFIGISSLLTLYRLVNYNIKLSPFSTSPVPKTSSPKTLSFINLIMQIKSSCSSITFFKSFLNIINFEGVISPRKTDF